MNQQRGAERVPVPSAATKSSFN